MPIAEADRRSARKIVRGAGGNVGADADDGHGLSVQADRPSLAFGDMNDDANDGGAYSGVSTTLGLRVSW